jgi:hypothetical protein
MGLLTPKDKKGDKKNSGPGKNAGQQSKFIPKGNTKGMSGAGKKPMTGGSQRGS